MAFPLTNSTTFNIESVLRQNILSSDYYNKTCLALSSSEEVIDELFENVQHVEPWMSGNARGPSTAFCLLHRLLTLTPSVREVREMIDHKDSPFIRAVGFLLLRYVCDFKMIWKWCSQYADDQEEFSPSPDGRKITMGDFVRDILLEQYYFETIFPRIPKPIMDSIVEELKARRLPHTPKGNAGTGGPDRRGVDDGSRRPASVKASLSVALGQRAPNRSAAKEDRQHSALASSGRPGAPGGTGRGSEQSRQPDRALPPRPAEREQRDRSPAAGSGRDRDRAWETAYGSRDDRAAGPSYRDRDADRGRDRDRERDRDRGDADRDRGRDRGYSDRADRERERDRGGRSTGTDRDRDRDRGRDVDRDRGRGQSDRDRDRARRSRSRSREPAGSGRDARDVFKESARSVPVSTTAVLSRY